MSGGYIGKTTPGVLPNITGYTSLSSNGSNNYLGGFVMTGGSLYGTSEVSSGSGQGGGGNHTNGKRLRIDASRSSSIYGFGWFDGDRVVPASIGALFVIKY